MGRPVRGHIALWLIGQSTDDPRVHDMLRTLTIYSAVRVLGPPVFHYGKMAAFIPSVAWHHWKAPKTGRPLRVTSPHGEWPVKYEYTKPRVSVGTATAGSRVVALGGLSWLGIGFMARLFTQPTIMDAIDNMAFMPEYEHGSI